MGMNSVYVPFKVEKGLSQQPLMGGQALGIKGFNVTVPHKIEVMDALCDIDRVAERIGAVNTLKLTENGYMGYNTDIIGLRKCFEERNIDISGKMLCLPEREELQTLRLCLPERKRRLSLLYSTEQRKRPKSLPKE